ncbi:hypothetical protein BD779DRAFT_1801026 [Infundibulicybe gibba]|nr:hypothetical protein BD779DRAFT_1801026 [Infundibulicybe gibba]
MSVTTGAPAPFASRRAQRASPHPTLALRPEIPHPGHLCQVIGRQALWFSRVKRRIRIATLQNQCYLDFAQIAKDLPLALDTLSLYSKVELWQRRPTDCSIFNTCRSLRKLKLWFGYGSLDDPKLLPFPWEQLTHLIITSRVSATHWRKIMARCKSVQLCSFNVDWITGEPRELGRYISEVESNPPIILPHLHTFAIFFESAAAPPNNNWFAKLELPALVKFSFHQSASHLSTARALSTEYLASLQRFLNTKSLRSLSLAYVHIPITRLLDTLRNMPHLRELHLSCDKLDYDPFFLALTELPHTPVAPTRVPLVPELEMLLILFHHTTAGRRRCDVVGLFEITASCTRNRPHYPLSEIMLKFEGTCGHSMLAAEEVREMLELYNYDVGQTIYTKDPPSPG